MFKSEYKREPQKAQFDILGHVVDSDEFRKYKRNAIHIQRH